MQVSLSIDINAPRDDVFAAALDVEAWPDMVSQLSASEILTPGPLGVGSKFTETRTMYGRTSTEEMTISEFVKPERVVFTSENHGMKYLVVQTFEEIPTGTRMHIEFGGTPTTTFNRLFGPLMAKMMKGTVEKMLLTDMEETKAWIERQ